VLLLVGGAGAEGEECNISDTSSSKVLLLDVDAELDSISNDIKDPPNVGGRRGQMWNNQKMDQTKEG